MTVSLVETVNLFSKSLTRDLKKIIPQIRIEAAAGLINRTPIDTGLARGNWQSSIGSPITSKTDRLDTEAGTAPTGGSGVSMREATSVAHQDIEKDFYVTNNVDYIRDLEFGASKQASGMVRLTVADFPLIVADAVREANNGNG